MKTNQATIMGTERNHSDRSRAAMRDLSDNTIESSMEVELARSFAHIFSAFLRHTQELPLYRESMYNLYQDYLNQASKRALSRNNQ